MNVLATGGAGYIGTHTVVALQLAGHDVVVVDNLSNSSESSLERAEKITGRQAKFYNVDIRDENALDTVFKQEQIDAVIHFAGLKAVGESEEKPTLYYQENIAGSIALLNVMEANKVRRIVFSSSATVYGATETVCYTETTPTSAINTYGQTKLIVENIMRDLARVKPEWQVALLRYFNPVGAHSSGLIGEDPTGIPNNLMPFVTQVAVGKRDKLGIFGNDYPTPDGTGVRDFIHVCDLAEGHVAALDYMGQTILSEPLILNLGAGKGCSVLEVVETFKSVNKVEVPYAFEARRAGDLAEFYADPTLANALLGWKTQRDLVDMCRDSWAWQSQNPNGYKT